MAARKGTAGDDGEPTAEVTMRVAISGTRNGDAWPGVGESVTLPADEAERIVRAGLAHPVDN